jgi:uncharacterized membrane protein YhiD involved in acid resistance
MEILLQADAIGIGSAIGQLAPTALLGLIIAALVFDRSKLVEKLDKAQDENDELQKAATAKAETVTEKLVSALKATERQFERSAEGQQLTNSLLQQLLNKN